MNGDLYNELPQEVYDKYNKVANATGSSVVIGITDMNIGYADTFALNALFNFVDTIADDERKMSILTISSQEEDLSNTEVTGEISMRLYSIFPLNVEKVMEETDEVEIIIPDVATE